MDVLSSPSFGYAFMLTLIAGLSTGIGGAMAFKLKRTNTKLLALFLGFSAGVMIYISFLELLPSAFEEFSKIIEGGGAKWLTAGAFFFGIAAIAVMDRFIPEFENPHQPRNIEELNDKNEARKISKLYHVGVMTAVVLAIHNAPEGLVTFFTALQSHELGLLVAFSIAMHNIPEGIAVAVPIFYATGSKRKAFLFSFVSGMVEPIGALVGGLLLSQLLGISALGFSYALVAGIMVFISLDELLPASQKFGHHHLSIYGFIAGMFAMALSLLLSNA